VVSILNLLRLAALALICLPFYFFNKNFAVFSFLRLAGPSFVKLGQILSTRPDLIGEDLAKALCGFQDNLPPFSQKEVIKSLQREFGQNYAALFLEFNYTPVAAASIAQVHKAKIWLKESKKEQDVAVKILRPKIARIIRRDILTLRVLVKIISYFSRFTAHTFSDIADLLADVSRSELDLLREAANASRLKEDLQGVKGFYVPQVFWAFSAREILVMEWLDGIPFSNEAAIKNSPFSKKQIAENLVVSYFNQVYQHGFFHADMHPGNLFLLKNGDIGVVDFGIMGAIDKKTRLAVAEILIGFLDRDYKKVAKIHVEAGLVPETTNVEDLSLSCRKIGETIVGSSVKDISLAKLINNLIIMTRDYEMVTRPELLLLQKTLLLVEGVGVMLDPQLNIWELARPWVKEWAKVNIGFDAKMRDATVGLFEVVRKYFRDIQK
jgi:ubiquinone biosynthesis protein